MPTLLAIDTSSNRCTVAVLAAEQVVTRSVETGQHNAQRVLPLLAEVLDAADITLQQLDAIAVMAGPGSFTGIRIGIGVAQGLGMANATPVLPLSILAVKAFAAMRMSGHTRVLVSDAARDNEVYFAAYQQSLDAGVTLLGNEQVTAPGAILVDPAYHAAGADWVTAGNGWQDRAAIQQHLGIQIAGSTTETDPDDADPGFTAADMCELARLRFLRGEAVPAEQALPNYVQETLHYVLATRHYTR